MASPTFTELFGGERTTATYAPGRVNLIGEHTDYNGGFVLPASIPQQARVDAAQRQGRRVRLWSAQFPARPVEYELGSETPRNDWSDYVQGMTQVLADEGPLQGFDARIESSVPVGAGLSSSAALAIAVGRALRAMCRLRMDDIALAVAAQRAENEFVGAPVGIMDQMAASLGEADSALFIDTRTLAYERISLPRSTTLIVIDSGVPHEHASGTYAARRGECAAAAHALGVPQLRDVSMGDIDEVERLADPLRRRARHVVTENQRVLDTVEALRSGDSERVGRLFNQSHRSMREDFEVTVPEIDQLVDCAQRVTGVYGARMTGGGFGGAMVAFATSDSSSSAAAEIASRYHHTTGRRGSILLPR